MTALDPRVVQLVKDVMHIAPLIFMVGWAGLLLLADALGKDKSARLWPLCAVGLVLGLGVTAYAWIDQAQPVDVFSGMLYVDRYALFFDGLFLIAGLLTVLLSSAYNTEHRVAFGDFYSLTLLSLVGMMILVHARDLLVLLIGLETMSLGVYALVACWHGNKRSAEAGLKYYVMGAVASAILVYGIALIYGATGQTNLYKLAAMADQLSGNRLFLVGLLLTLGAMGFKVALVPFHAWTPDVYEGAPTTVTGFMAAAVKAAAFGVLLRVFTVAFGADEFVFGPRGWAQAFKWLAMITILFGNLAALRQTNIKRMLAYSSIAHAGYIMIGVVAAGVLPKGQGGPVLFYLLAYTFTTLGAFGMIAWLGSRDNERLGLNSWAGLGASHPAAAAGMTLFMLSLGGVPPTAGFFAKFYIFKAALQHPALLNLVLVAVLGSVISFFYYLKPVVAMYFQAAAEDDTAPTPLRSGALSTALILAAIAVLVLGLIPSDYLHWIDQSVAALGGR